MTEPKFTPGPWETSLTDDTFVRSADNDIAVMVGDYNDDVTSLIMTANANLMAAAPDLYAALKETLEIAARHESGDYIERANAAMRKARGE